MSEAASAPPAENAADRKALLVKARFPDELPPNVRWMTIRLGNCEACRYFQHVNAIPGDTLQCQNPAIETKEFLDRYLFDSDCPGFEAGIAIEVAAADPWSRGMLDTMKVLGLASGEPGQRVEILQRLDWTPEREADAENQQKVFRAMAYARAEGIEIPAEELRDDMGDIAL